MTRRPPRLAHWLLRHLVGRESALVGDLVEEYRAGRSSLWLWRQVLWTVAVSLVQAVKKSATRHTKVDWVRWCVTLPFALIATLVVQIGVEVVFGTVLRETLGHYNWWTTWISKSIASPLMGAIFVLAAEVSGGGPEGAGGRAPDQFVRRRPPGLAAAIMARSARATPAAHERRFRPRPTLCFTQVARATASCVRAGALGRTADARGAARVRRCS